jgi:hypothetical protein
MSNVTEWQIIESQASTIISHIPGQFPGQNRVYLFQIRGSFSGWSWIRWCEHPMF